MEAIILPTWISPAPKNWGSKARGKISADEWRVIYTIHLPITLIHLWSAGSKRQRMILANFMDLIAAVRVANFKSLSPLHKQLYNHRMFNYAEQVPTLFPNEQLKLSLHVALHLGDMLGDIGPVHAYSAPFFESTPFFERYIKFLHQQNINRKSGMFWPSWCDGL